MRAGIHDGARLHHIEELAGLLDVQLLVHGDDDTPCGKGGDIGADPLGGGVTDDRHALARQSHGVEGGGALVDHHAELGVGHGQKLLALKIAECNAVAVVVDGLNEIQHVPHVRLGALHTGAVDDFIVFGHNKIPSFLGNAFKFGFVPAARLWIGGCVIKTTTSHPMGRSFSNLDLSGCLTPFLRGSS